MKYPVRSCPTQDVGAKFRVLGGNLRQSFVNPYMTGSCQGHLNSFFWYFSPIRRRLTHKIKKSIHKRDFPPAILTTRGAFAGFQCDGSGTPVANDRANHTRLAPSLEGGDNREFLTFPGPLASHPFAFQVVRGLTLGGPCGNLSA